MARRARPVFVDRTGRRLRLARLVSVGVAVFLAAIMGMLVFALSGAPSGQAPDLPAAARDKPKATTPAPRPPSASPTPTPSAATPRTATRTTARTAGATVGTTSRPGRAPTNRGKPTKR
ncbi:hypothetical protein GCM10009682_49880 [Luedemannella flava]|uniref:Uncharacterized protein n=1 Tax=Luedemannella flava TaxID=349316 RepID=A0ABN2MFQ2_9ACTN